MGMQPAYADMETLIADMHKHLSVRGLAADLGLYTHAELSRSLVPCCFHDDRTPSLQLGDGFFRCYAASCGVRGDIIKFAQLHWNCGFLEAVQRLASMYVVDISGIKIKNDGRMQALAKEWKGYLSAMESAPPEARAMQRELFPQEVGYDPSIMYAVLPITSRSGAVLGFTKRRVDALMMKHGKFHYDSEGQVVFDGPKWKHSSLQNSMIGLVHNIFNLGNASGAIRKSGQVLLCEGPKDVIAWQRAGVQQAIATCGTTNANHAWEEILPVGKIFLCGDGDASGRAANVNAIKYLAGRQPMEGIFVISLPEGKDPYDILTEKGVETLLELKKNALPALGWISLWGDRISNAGVLNSLPEWERMSHISALCRAKQWSVHAVESWLGETAGGKPDMDRKSYLLKVVHGEGDGSMLPDKAARLLKMVYGWNGEG